MEKPALVVARLNDRCQPAHRARYEKPLDELLEQKGLGNVEGGGSQLDENGEVAYCEISIALRSVEPATLQVVIAALEKLGAPRGSKLLVGPGSELPFGRNEGLAFYFDNVGLPPEVYATHDINDVLESFGQALDGVGAMHSYLNGARETAVYVYGPSFEKMKSVLAPVADRHSLCKGARMVKCA